MALFAMQKMERECNQMISKHIELFREVLNHKVCGLYPYEVEKVCQPTDNIVAVSYKYTAEGEWVHYNIHELANKCKEWAVIKQSYNVASLLDYSGYACIIRQEPITFLNTERRYRARTEPEAIFMACQWILDNRSEI